MRSAATVARASRALAALIPRESQAARCAIIGPHAIATISSVVVVTCPHCCGCCTLRGYVRLAYAVCVCVCPGTMSVQNATAIGLRLIKIAWSLLLPLGRNEMRVVVGLALIRRSFNWPPDIAGVLSL